MLRARAVAAVLIAGSLLAAPASAPSVDLDVGVPPGSPTSWGRRFPAITPPRRPLFPVTPRSGAAGGTVAQATVDEPDIRLADSFGIVRILTWDITGHMPWVNEVPRNKAPETGAASEEAPLPRPGDAMYWTTVSSLLRLLLHPQLVSKHELTAHLIEVGEPVVGGLDAAEAEPGLVALCKLLRTTIVSERRAWRPLEGRTLRETMMSRFVAEELVASHPYDPEGGFGRRMFLFADEIEPLLARYASHDDSFTRRNAVAALSRYHTASAMEALLVVATETGDPVVLMRALSALGAYRSVSRAKALHERLVATTDPVEVVALVEAIGRVAIPAAVPTLLALADEAWKNDPDVLQAVMAALVRMGVALADDSVTRLAKKVERAVSVDPGRFRVKPKIPGPTPDIADQSGTRGEILGQLALLLRARMSRDDKALIEKVAALLGEKRSEPGGVRYFGRFSNRSLELVHPPVRFLYLETLPLLGEVGLTSLEWVADDVSVEPPLRGYALSLCPPESRGPRAVRILTNREAAPEMKVYALDVLHNDGHPKLEELARRELAKAVARGVESSPALRYLWMRALRALSERRLLDTDDVLPLLRLVTTPGAGEDPRRLAIRMLGELVAEAGGLTRKDLRRRIFAVLDLMIEHKVSPAVRAGTRQKLRQRMEAQLVGLRRGEITEGQQLTLVNTLRSMLMGRPRDQAEFEPVVLLEEEILFALGRTGSMRAVQALLDFTRDHPDSPHLPQACLALGVAGQRAAALPLVRFLLHRDGFTRLCAYESVRRLTDREHPADWMYGEPRVRTVAAEKFFRWLRK